MLKAAAEAKAEGICIPILLGNEERLQKIAAEENISLEGIEIVNLRHDRETERRHRYAKILSEKKPAKVSRMRKPAKRWSTATHSV
mgnify:CR=1 FL=1